MDNELAVAIGPFHPSDGESCIAGARKVGLSGGDESFKYGKIPIGVSPLRGPHQLVTPEAWAADNKARKVIATERGAVPDALNFKTLNSTI